MTWLVCLHNEKDHLVKVSDGEQCLVGCITTELLFQSAVTVATLPKEEEEVAERV